MAPRTFAATIVLRLAALLSGPLGAIDRVQGCVSVRPERDIGAPVPGVGAVVNLRLFEISRQSLDQSELLP